jgi:hypothetical protein
MVAIAARRPPQIMAPTVEKVALRRLAVTRVGMDTLRTTLWRAWPSGDFAQSGRSGSLHGWSTHCHAHSVAAMAPCRIVGVQTARGNA